ncbi:hypothetical protein [Arthrobacter sp. USHLN218]|uniref:hypothetical protein n=1 Tax=Arthrobacter sp. USHLN218 TaxID=3081232 RepID=UPI00301935A7
MLTSRTGILVRAVEGRDDFAARPETYLADLFGDEDAAAEAWLRIGVCHKLRYNDGVVRLAWDGIPLLGVPNWDDVCGIWHSLVGTVDGYLSSGRGETVFPDQPLQVILERIRGGALVTVGDTRLRLDPAAFCVALLDEAERFWSWTERHDIPVDAAWALTDVARIRRYQAATGGGSSRSTEVR